MDIKQLNLFYRIDKDGKVWSIRSKIFLKWQISNSGYARVTVCKNNKSYRYSVHRLVATMYIPNPNDYPIVHHKDGNKLNNHINNLEWVTQQMNQLYKIEKDGKQAPNAKITQEQANEIRVIEGKTLKVIGNQYGLSISQIHRIRRNERWI